MNILAMSQAAKMATKAFTQNVPVYAKFMAGLTPGVSIAVIIGFFIFAAGFVMTLISTLKAQWGHKAGEGKFIVSGVTLLVLSFLVIGISSGVC